LLRLEPVGAIGEDALEPRDFLDEPLRPREPRPVVVLTRSTDTSEIEALLDAVGFPLIGVIRQNRNRPDPSTFLGSGRVAEAKRLIEGRDPLFSTARPLVVVDGAIKPPALFNLEDETGAEVWDRIRLILEIFQQHARVKEARLQVELARLRYELPFVHEALHRQLTGEHPGFMGGGDPDV
jgi:GTPase